MDFLTLAGQKARKSIKHPSARDNVGVVGVKNKTKRKVLIELGYITSPKDANLIYSNID